MSWEQLQAIYVEAAEQARRDRDEPPTDCPNDGTTLQPGPDGELHCPFDGWTYP